MLGPRVEDVLHVVASRVDDDRAVSERAGPEVHPALEPADDVARGDPLGDEGEQRLVLEPLALEAGGADGETGLLVPPGDVPALRAALVRLLGDRELRRRLGAAGRERARGLLAWDAVTDMMLNAYEEASAAPTRRSPTSASTTR
ncbi:MAG TPA: hypothetical protein VM184_07430 [Gaiellaceae bacterium]|nr:hypothetical protein [Gaiellaceae bacterium]